MLNGNASKFITSLVGLLGSGLLTYFGTAPWEPIAAMALTAIGVYLVPNQTVGSAVPVATAPATDMSPSWQDQHQGNAGQPINPVNGGA